MYAVVTESGPHILTESALTAASIAESLTEAHVERVL